MCKISILLLIFLSVGCGAGPGESDATDEGTEAETLGDNIQGETEGVEASDFSVEIEVDKTKGNAPLLVNFTGVVHGVPESNLEFSWDFGTGISSTKKSPGAFVYYKPGEYVVVFQVVDKSSKKSAKDTVTIKVYDYAEIEISQLLISSPVVIAPGGEITLVFSLYNKGDRIDETVSTAIFMSKDEKLNKDADKILKTIDIEGLEDGRFKEVKVTFQAEIVKIPSDTSDGIYFIFAYADYKNVVNEKNENNNVSLATSFIKVDKKAHEKADLKIDPPEFPKGLKLTTGEALSYSVNISNIGATEAKNFRFAIFLSADAVLDDKDIKITEDGESQIFLLEKGKSVKIHRSFLVKKDYPEGDFFLIGKIDILDSVVELDENNNIAVSENSFNITHKIITGPDLKLNSVTVSPEDTYWGGSVKVDLEIENAGNKNSPSYVTSIFISETPSLNPFYDTKLLEFTSDDLKAGSKIVISKIVPISNMLKPMNYYISAILDLGDKIEELDESNNWKLYPNPIKVFKEAFVELSLSNLYVHPMVVKAGFEIKVNYFMKNLGSTSSGAFVNYIVFSQDKTISAQEVKSKKDILVLTVPIGTIPPGKEVERVEKFIVPVALPHNVGEYYVGVIGDAENNLPTDKNKENNKLVTQTKLTVLEPKGGCIEDQFEPNNFLEESVTLPEGLTDSLGMCASEDWYRVNIKKGDSLIVTMKVTSPLYLEPRPYDIDIELISPLGKVVDKSYSTGSIERVAVYAVDTDSTYYLRVKPKQTGWEGHYTLDINVVSPLEGIDLMPHHLTALPEKIYPGGLVSVSGDLLNLGGMDAPSFETALFFSEDEIYNTGDTMLDLFTMEGLSAVSKTDFSRNVILPSDAPGGIYYIIAVVDKSSLVMEEDELNNVAVSGKLELDESIACVDDGFEPNNSAEIATPLKGTSAYIQDLMVCPQLDDWYEFDLPEGVNFGASVNYTHEPSKGYIYLQLFDENKTALIDSSTAASLPSVGIPYVFHGGKYYLRVYNAPQAGKSAPYKYTLAVNVSEPFPSDICLGDKHEPNYDHNSARFIGCGENRITLCKKDKDFFKVSLLSGDALALTLKHPQSHLKLSLYEDPLKSPTKSIVGNGTIDYIAFKDIIVYIGVELKSETINLTEFNYSLTVDGIQGIDLTCSNLSIFPVEVYQGEDLSLDYSINNMCMDDSPAFYHSIYLSSDPLLDAGDIELLNIETGGGIEGKGVLLFSNKVMVPLETPPGNYNLIIYADPEGLITESQEDNNYISGKFAVMKVCLNDMFEPNNTFAHSSVISEGIFTSPIICPYDLDFYTLYVEAGATVNVKILFSHKDGDLDMRFYGPSDQAVPLAVSLSKDDDEEISYTVAKSGYYFIRVNGFLGNQNSYKLVVDLL